MVYDEKFETVYGRVSPGVFDEDLWNSFLLKDSLEQRLTSYDFDRQDESPHREVIKVAKDLYRDFVDPDRDSDDDSSCTSAPEGGEEPILDPLPVSRQ